MTTRRKPKMVIFFSHNSINSRRSIVRSNLIRCHDGDVSNSECGWWNAHVEGHRFNEKAAHYNILTGDLLNDETLDVTTVRASNMIKHCKGLRNFWQWVDAMISCVRDDIRLKSNLETFGCPNWCEKAQ